MVSIAIVTDRGYIRSEVIEDANASGIHDCRTLDFTELGDRLRAEGEVFSFHEDIIIVDCPGPSEADIEVLTWLSNSTARHGNELIVTTSIQSLDDVFSCLDTKDVQLLVNPSRADRILALGHSLARTGNSVREMSPDDRMTLLRLSEQVALIGQNLERLSGEPIEATVPELCVSNNYKQQFFSGPQSGRALRITRPALPDPRLVRKILRQRQVRAQFFDAALFADPCWDMLLDLTAARAEHVRVTVSSLCIASNVPPTTALRWIRQMTHSGLLLREEDDGDRRRAFITLSDDAALAMARYFAQADLSATMVL